MAAHVDTGWRHPLLDALVPTPPMTVDAWADERRVLSPKGSSEPGRWRTERTPYLREIMRALSSDTSYTDIWFCKGAQIGATEVGLNWIMWVIDSAPGPAMIVQPTLDMCKRLMRQKLDPAIKASPTVAAKLPPPRSKDGGNSMFAKDFPGGALMLAGANSATSLRSASVKFLFMDEVDAYPPDLDGEGDPIELAKARTRTFHRAKRFYPSTPTVKDASRIEQGFSETDQRYYYVPCPHCGTSQIIEWGRIRWDEQDDSVPAWMECVTGCRIEEHAKTDLLARGEWRATSPEKASTKVVGFHLSALYSPYGWYSWTDARNDFRKAKGSVALLKQFTNTVLGESYRETGEAPPWRRLYGRREDYARGTIPRGGILLTAGADVQKDRIEVELRAWGRRHESWSVDYLVIEGDTADIDSVRSPWRELSALLSRTFPHESGPHLRIERLAIDSSAFTQTVYAWVRKQDRRRVSAVKGSATQMSPVGVPTQVDVTEGGRRIRRGLKLWTVGVDVLKSELYGWLRQDPPGPGEPAPHGWFHYPGYDEEWFKQLTAEEMVQKLTKTGHRHYVWEKRRERNEALDCAVYARAAAIIVGVDRWDERDWAAVEGRLGIDDLDIDVEVEAMEPAPPAPVTPPPAPPPPPPPKPSIWGPGRRKSIWDKR